MSEITETYQVNQTEQIQTLLKICDEYKTKFDAMTTAYNLILKEYEKLLDEVNSNKNLDKHFLRNCILTAMQTVSYKEHCYVSDITKAAIAQGKSLYNEVLKFESEGIL